MKPKNIEALNTLAPFESIFEDDVPDFDLVSILNDIENTQGESRNNTAAVTRNNNIANNIPKTMFSNRNFENVTFNFTK